MALSMIVEDVRVGARAVLLESSSHCHQLEGSARSMLLDHKKGHGGGRYGVRFRFGFRSRRGDPLGRMQG